MITLLTDFGLADYFVGAVKGVILSIHSNARLIDLSHEVPPHDIQFAAFTLAACARDFPANTVHLVVVDPGVGSERRPIVVEAADQFFVGPDNGVFTHIYHRDPRARVFHATQAEFFRSEPSDTFHGRDIFAPLAAHLDLGMNVERVGPAITDYIRLAQVERAQGSAERGARQHHSHRSFRKLRHKPDSGTSLDRNRCVD